MANSLKINWRIVRFVVSLIPELHATCRKIHAMLSLRSVSFPTCPGDKNHRNQAKFAFTIAHAQM